MNRLCLRAAATLSLFLCLSGSFAQTRNVAILGSSTSACFGLNFETECYVGRLKNFYNSAGPVLINTINLAQGGTDVYYAMPTSYVPPFGRPGPDPQHNIDKALELGADIILVNFPTNDYNVFTKHEVMECFRTIKKYANQHGKPCYVTTTQPRNDVNFSTQAARDSLRDLRDSVLTEFGIFAINFYDGLATTEGSILPQFDQGDHTHLTADGHFILFGRVRDKNILSAQAALPLVNLNFSARLDDKKVVLSWQNDRSYPAKSFTVQRSADGVKFSAIGTLQNDAKATYDFTDNASLPGKSYYRLEVALVSGKIDHSPVVRINAGKLAFEIQQYFYSASTLHLNLQTAQAQRVTIKIFSTVGTLIAQQVFNCHQAMNQLSLPTTRLSNGGYVLSVIGEHGERLVQSMFIRE